MKHTITSKARLLLPVAVLLTAGCATMTEAQRDAREYERVDFRNQFIADRGRCLARGGRIYVGGPGGILDRDDIPRTRVFYACI